MNRYHPYANHPILRSFFLFILAAVTIAALIFPAIQNGYPLLYSDSASYICSGHDGVVPIDRPIVYGLIVRHISMSFSLWFVVIFQAAIFIALTWFTIRLIYNRGRALFYTAVVGTATGLLTGASNYISQIMPDIFSAYMIWSVVLLCLYREKSYRWLFWGLALISATVHYSNLITVSAFASLLLIALLIFRHRFPFVITVRIQLASLIVLPWIAMLFINYAYEKEFFVNRSTPIFLTGRLIEIGLVQQYLSTDPGAKEAALYPHKDDLPEKAWQFIWNDDSPLYNDSCMVKGWGNCWLVHAGPYKEMIRSILMKPDLLGRFIHISLIDWARQMVDFEIGHLTTQGAGSAFDEIITRYFTDAPMFKRSDQFNEDLFYKRESNIQYFTLIGSLIIIGLLIWRIGVPSRNLLGIFLMMVSTGITLNALFCSAFSGVLNRYQGRVIWLIPWIAIVVLLCFTESLLQNRQKAGKALR